jgi:hypothetical protein
MSASSAQLPNPHDPRSFSDSGKSTPHDMIAGGPLPSRLPTGGRNHEDTAERDDGLAALRVQLGALRGCDGPTRRSGSGQVCGRPS